MKSYDLRFRIVSFLADKGYDSSEIRQALLRNKVKPVIKVSETRIKPQYLAWFQEKYLKRVSVERFFSRLKTYPNLKRLNIKGIYPTQTCFLSDQYRHAAHRIPQ